MGEVISDVKIRKSRQGRVGMIHDHGYLATLRVEGEVEYTRIFEKVLKNLLRYRENFVCFSLGVRDQIWKVDRLSDRLFVRYYHTGESSRENTEK